MKLFKFKISKNLLLPIDLYAKNKKEALQMINNLIDYSNLDLIFNNFGYENKITISNRK